MIDAGQGKEIKVLIGQVHLTRPPNRLQAVLGSCVALAVFDPVERVAGMAHVLLPCSEGREKSSLPGKYADDALRNLLEHLPRYGARRERLQARIAGGAHMFRGTSGLQNGDVGGLNVKAVREALAAARVPILSAEVGGEKGRRVEFYPESLELRVAHLDDSPLPV